MRVGAICSLISFAEPFDDAQGDEIERQRHHEQDEAEREGAFLSFLQGDGEVNKLIPEDDLAEIFDLGYHTRHVDTIFERVFGKS